MKVRGEYNEPFRVFHKFFNPILIIVNNSYITTKYDSQVACSDGMNQHFKRFIKLLIVTVLFIRMSLSLTFVN